MIRPALLAIGLVLAGTPAGAQTVGPCPGNVGSAAVSKPSWVLFDLGSAVVKPEYKATIAEAAKTAKARQATKVCVVGQTDKLGDKSYNAKLAQQRSQAVAAELIKAGYPAKDVVIASNPEAFGNMSFGGSDASEKDRRVTIIPR
ncbi:MAG: OmpA family protein [Reyranella sp.]|uniref:OmpA family protein n=2 Tax=Pseudomonadota TaxID=1224 RepID=UPI001AC42EFB|nr:OmpA family protein [Reyranella sp.]MBN9086853.1 OmpA family protein [Reyranella sp.]